MEFWLTIENWIVHYTTRNEVEGGGGGVHWIHPVRLSVRLCPDEISNSFHWI